jgi:hypothetical protein
MILPRSTSPGLQLTTSKGIFTLHQVLNTQGQGGGQHNNYYKLRWRNSNNFYRVFIHKVSDFIKPCKNLILVSNNQIVKVCSAMHAVHAVQCISFSLWVLVHLDDMYEWCCKWLAHGHNSNQRRISGAIVMVLEVRQVQISPEHILFPSVLEQDT